MDDVTDSRPRVLSGIQPTATRSTSATTWARCATGSTLQDGHDAFYCVVDLHAITMEFPTPADAAPPHPGRRRPAARDRHRPRALARCSCRATCPSTPQLAWVLNCLTGFGEASRMTQFKDKSAKGRRARQRRAVHLPDPAGRRHPALPGRTRCRSGEDQRQHLELTRDLAAAVQRPLRRRRSRCPSPHPQGHGQDLRPAGPDRQDEQVAAAGGRHRPARRPRARSARRCARR